MIGKWIPQEKNDFNIGNLFMAPTQKWKWLKVGLLHSPTYKIRVILL